MDIRKAFDAALIRMKEKNWDKIYVAVDIHDTILRACYDDEETYQRNGRCHEHRRASRK